MTGISQVGVVRVDNDLEVWQAGSITHLHKGKGLLVPDCLDPSSHHHLGGTWG